ncbi:MAG: tyrosine-type recombinase/integrase [Candidatus Nanoarchaeia archaeon]
MTNPSNKYELNSKLDSKIDFEVIKNLITQIQNSRDKQLFELLLKTGCKTRILEEKTHLSARRIQQIVTFYSTKYLGKKLLPKDIRKLSIEHEQNSTRNFQKTKKFSGIKTLRVKRILTDEQIRKIKQKIKNKNHELIIRILTETGCTLSELTNIKPKDVIFTDLKIGTRKIPISKELKKEIEGKKSEYVFLSRQSLKISEKRVFQIVKKYAELAGLQNVSPQTFRNTYVLQKLRKEDSEHKTKQLTGIKNLNLSHYGVGSEVNHE